MLTLHCLSQLRDVSLHMRELAACFGPSAEMCAGNMPVMLNKFQLVWNERILVTKHWMMRVTAFRRTQMFAMVPLYYKVSIIGKSYTLAL